MAVNLHSTHFRFGIDELAENTHNWYANEDTNPAAGVIPLDTVFLLRFTLQETGGTAASNTDMQFEFSINGAAFAALTTTSVGPRAIAAAALTNGGNCTKRLSGTGTFESSGAGQTEDGLSGGNNNDIAASGNSETECGIIIDSADVANADVVTFRLTSPDFTVTNDVVPTVTVSKSAPVTVTPGTASLTITRQTPTVSVSDNKTATPGVVSLTLTTFAPTVTGGSGTTVVPGTASLALTQFEPTVSVSDNQVVTPGIASLTTTALAPTVTATQNVTVTPGTASLTLTSFAPTVTGIVEEPAAEVMLTPGRNGGGMTMRKRKRGMPDDDMLRFAKLVKDDNDLVEILPAMLSAVVQMGPLH